MSILEGIELPHSIERGVLTVEALHDPTVEHHGYPVASGYAELFWLPFIGPAALLALRRMVLLLGGRPGPIDVPIGEFAYCLALSDDMKRRSAPLPRALLRLAAKGFAETDQRSYRVRTHVAPVPEHRLRNLPRNLQALHARRPNPNAHRPAA